MKTPCGVRVPGWDLGSLRAVSEHIGLCLRPECQQAKAFREAAGQLHRERKQRRKEQN